MREAAAGGGGIGVTIMAKAPRPGEVKTRLCPPLDPASAAELYRCFLLDKIEQVGLLAGTTPAIAYAPAEAGSLFEKLAPGFVLIPQQGPDLGSRLANGFLEFFGRGYSGALMVDSDTPTLPVTLLERAVELLASPGADLVLGPSEDGGYYLIGLRSPRPELFRDIPWSTSEVLPETLRRARALDLSVASLASWFDIDTGADLARLREGLEAVQGPAPRHTRAFFERRPW